MLVDFFKLNASASLRTFATAAEFLAHISAQTIVQNTVLARDTLIQETSVKAVQFENVQLSKTVFERTTFRNCLFRDCLLVGTKFLDCEFHDCRFENCNTHKFDLKDVYIDPSSFQLDKSYQSTASNVGVYLFQELFKNANETFQSVFASTADIEQRRWKRYQLQYDLKHRNVPRTAIRKRIVWDFLFDKVAKYGYGPLRFFLFSLVIFTLIALFGERIWSAMGMFRNGVAITAVTFVDALYYCMLLMTTLGFSDLVPTSFIGKGYVIFCAVFGISWAGLFTAILVRRVIR
jgi:hypothetical protein